MALRRMTSEGKLLDRNSRIYRNIGEDSPSPFSTLTGLATPHASSVNLAEKPIGDLSRGLPTNRNSRNNNLSACRTHKSVTLSPSRLSVGGGSIWEDVSVRAESPDPEPGAGGRLALSIDTGARENVHISRCSKAIVNGTSFESPRSEGIGLGIDNALWGTPGSLYDPDGFLKEY